MIFAKVPYLSLASKLNKRKMELYDGWYNFQTLKSFQQGLGRPVRHKTDWCKTYLLDASFESFFGRSPLPHIISDRLVETDISNLDLPLTSADDEFEAMLREMEGNA
jgi:Rad3-related DNA helicase